MTRRCPRIRAVLFDLDDTLWDFDKTLSAAHTAFVSRLARRGHVNLAVRLQDRQVVAREIAEIAANGNFKIIDYMEIRKNFHAKVVKETRSEICHLALTDEWTSLRTSSAVFFPGAQEMLGRLRELSGVVIGAVTNGTADAVGHFHGLFDFQVSPATAGAHKPQSEIYIKAAKMTGIGNMSEILFVGDNYENDVLGPKTVGMRTCLVSWPKEGAEGVIDGGHADFVVKDVTEVYGIVAQANSPS